MQTLFFLGFIYLIFQAIKWLFQGEGQSNNSTPSSHQSTQNSCILEEDPEILRPDESDFDPTDYM
jgi:threonine/homoserine/homoserine lactone efflux protein